MFKGMSEERKHNLDALFDAFSIVSEGTYVYLCDMKYDVSRWSKNAVDLFDLPDEYMVNAGQIWEEYIHPDDREEYHASIAAIFGGTDGGHDMQYRARTREGNYVVCTCRGVVIRDKDGAPSYFAGAIKNHGAYGQIDQLTGLRNHYGFFEDIKTVMIKNKVSNILLIGIDKLSKINEIYGYDIGNRVIQKIARQLYSTVGNRGGVYRMDGGKFSIVSQSVSAEELQMLYNNLQNYLKNDFTVDDIKQNVLLNCGLLHVDNFDISPETVYSCLNYAYNKSKFNKHGDLYRFHNRLSDENRAMLEKLNIIRGSIVEDCAGFFLCYQPIVNCHTENVQGAEALLRWKNDRYGLVPPDHFVPVLEEDNLFPELGAWILKKAMTDGKQLLQRYPDFVMNVNLSYSQLEKKDFVNVVSRLLDETGFPAENLCLELTERCRLIDIDLLKNIIAVLQQRGVRFALDDFGTGFAALDILKKLPVDTVKIDREFVKDIESDEKDQQIVKYISKLAAVYGAKVCAEGIENAATRDLLREFSVSSLQGYYYSKPIVYDEFVEKYVECA
ncbi:MAG: GGDEF and EAL domain-containing protein [Succinivibrio sp.]|nr:GGDEF and EAL domain-containing protein [Succinivibrio sp.]